MQPDPHLATQRPVLIIPGLFNSPPGHWQSHWQATLPTAERVEQADWETPRLGEWVAALAEAVRARPGAILVAHSLGCALVAHLSDISGGRGIGGALLVAPADLNPAGPAGRRLRGFYPMPRAPLPFPATVIASRADPYVALERAQAFAEDWRADFVDLGDAGHITSPPVTVPGPKAWTTSRIWTDGWRVQRCFAPGPDRRGVSGKGVQSTEAHGREIVLRQTLNGGLSLLSNPLPRGRGLRRAGITGRKALILLQARAVRPRRIASIHLTRPTAPILALIPLHGEGASARRSDAAAG